MFTCWPHRTRGEGQFAALLRRNGDGEAFLPRDASLPRPGRAEQEMLRQALPELLEATHILGNTLAFLPDCPDVKGVKVYRMGLHLAEIRGKHLVPEHAAAYCAAGKGRRTEVSPGDALRYMAGEQIEGDAAGWTVLCCRGIPLGWGKGSGGVIKNHYPKGLWNGKLIV